MPEAEARPFWYSIVGITLACSAGFFVGLSLILQKKGLIETKEKSLKTGKDQSYLTNTMWWLGLLSMAIGELSNFGAYAFSPAILVTPLYAVSVVVSAILSVVMLKETLNFSGSMGVALCLIGSTLIVLHSPSTTTTETLDEFFHYVIAPGFLAYSAILAIVLIWLVFKLGPRYGHVNPMIHLSTTALGGAYLVNSAQGFGAAIVYSITHWNSDNQFLKWSMYPLFLFVVLTVLFQITYLNKALAYFPTAIVTPLNFVFFSTATLVTSAVLYQGFNVSSSIEAITIVLGFVVIIIGVSLLFQYNLKLNKLAQVGWIEDINDEEENIEEEQGPLALMRESFPFHPEKPRKAQIQPEEEYVRQVDEDDGQKYVRQRDNQILASSLIEQKPMVPMVSLTEQIQQSHQQKQFLKEETPFIEQNNIEKEHQISIHEEPKILEDLPQQQYQFVGQIEDGSDEASSYTESLESEQKDHNRYNVRNVPIPQRNLVPTFPNLYK